MYYLISQTAHTSPSMYYQAPKLRPKPHIIKSLKLFNYRKQRVYIFNLSQSWICNTISVVPKGSFLGPLLFSSYINNLCDITLSYGSKITLYADDMVLCKIIETVMNLLARRIMLTQWCSGPMTIYYNLTSQNLKPSFYLISIAQCHQISYAVSTKSTVDLSIL